MTPAERTDTRLACLVPVRNGARHLPAYLDSVSQFADAVVALDDGSTDETRSLLEGHPLVTVLLTNPRRESYLGWNDGENRNRLLQAATEVSPGWILFLDADERIDSSDGAALRRFIASDALRSCAYGFQLYRMIDHETFDPDYEWIYRLFAFVPGQRVPDRKLDFVPIPTTIHPSSLVHTSLRIQHFGEESDKGRERRLAKYREADPVGEFSSYYGRLRPLVAAPPEGFPRWQRRSDEAPVLVRGPGRHAPLAERSAAPRPTASRAQGSDLRRDGPYLVCLLPARNCENDLPGWFESVSKFADAVVALDDGSTDGTAQYLRQHHLVKLLLTNETRGTYAGWDDSANRNRLLDASAQLSPSWILSLDSDERISADDGRTLRRFLLEEAVSGFVYGFPRYRMVDDLDHYDDFEYVAWRLFAWQPGQRFSDDRLHLTPVPTSIPVSRWVETTVRIQHLAGLTQTRRQARWAKYQEADPDLEWEKSYDYVRVPVVMRSVWLPRSPGLPVVLDPEQPEQRLEWELANLDLDGPVLTVAVLADSTTTRSEVESTIATLRTEATEPPVEILVIAPPAVAPQLPFPVADHNVNLRVLAPEESTSTLSSLRGIALRASRGDYILIVRPGERVTSNALTEILDAHERGFQVVGGEVINQSDSFLGWTSFFLDHAASLPGLPSGPLELAPSLGSMDRAVLRRAEGLTVCSRLCSSPPDASSLSPEVLEALGLRSWRADLVLHSGTPYRRWADLFHAQFLRGRTLGRVLASSAWIPEDGTTSRSLIGRAFLREWARLGAIRRSVGQSDPMTRARFRSVAPMVALGESMSWAGLVIEILRRRPGRETSESERYWRGRALGATTLPNGHG